MAVAAALLLAWLIVDPRTPDLAAQTYRVGVFDRLGFTVWDENWYAGHHMPGYSLLYPPLASLLGIRLLASMCLLASTALFARFLSTVHGPAGRWGAVWFAGAAAGDLWIGRLSFALGVAFAAGAALALARRRPRLAAVCGALCAAASPVAGVLLALAGATHWLLRHGQAPAGATLLRRGRALSVVVPPLLVVGALALLFGEGGSEPYPLTSFAATAVVVVAFIAALPSGERVLRGGAVIYLLACVLSLVVPTPMGANVERYGVLLAGPLLISAWAARGPLLRTGLVLGLGRLALRWLPWKPRVVLAIVRRVAPRLIPSRPGSMLALGREMAAPRGGSAVALVSARRGGSVVALLLALCASWLWTVWGPVRETAAVAGSESTSARYYLPVERFLARRGPVRVEVPFTRSHWEAALLAPTVSLARGWEKQLDERFDHVLLAGGLTPSSYRRWLSEQGVAYVALPDTTLDPSSAQEGVLIRGGLSYLREVYVSPHWRIYAVLAPTPLARGPGELVSLAHEGFTLHARTPGRFLMRVHFTRYFALERGRGCVTSAPAGWTLLDATAAGTVEVRASFSLGRALDLQGGCSRGRTR